MIRRQLPVASPISPSALAAALIDSFRAIAAVQSQAREVVRRTFGAEQVRLTDSGTSALVLALRLAVPSGGTVGLPAYACVDLGAAALFAGVRVRLYDVDPETLSPDLESVRRLLERGVDAIVVAHLFGYPADVPAVRALAAAEGVVVIEDAAQGAGGTLNGTRLGCLSELSVLSFGRGKGLCAGGGGALLAIGDRWAAPVSDLALAPSSRGWGGLASTAAQWVLGRPSLFALPSMVPWLHLGEMVYHEASEPAAMSMTSASLVPSAFSLERRDLSERRARARQLDVVARRAADVAAPSSIAGGEPGYLRYALRDLTGRRTAPENLGIGHPYPRPWVEQPELAGLLLPAEAPTAAASQLASSLITMPTHQFVRASDIAAMGGWLERST